MEEKWGWKDPIYKLKLWVEKKASLLSNSRNQLD